jgi:hypothetical protein
MSDSRSTDVIDRYTAKPDKKGVKGASGIACVVFTAVMGCAFWAGAVVASTPLIP